MKIKLILTHFLLLNTFFAFCQVSSNDDYSLKDGFQDRFHIGTALNVNHVTGKDNGALEVVKQHFNAIVSENSMKSGMLQPREGEFYFDMADKFVEFGEEHGMLVNGHTLIWHSQAPRWFFVDDQGNEVSKEVLIDRMRTHIFTVVERYKGRVHTWDVVNETILDDGSWRKSKFYEIIGEDFVKLAFEFTHQADPEAKLYYNDFSMANPGKREGVVAMVKELQRQGVKIDGIGMQGHIGLEYPTIEEFEKSILAFSELGVDVSITELDLSVLPSARRDMGADVATNVEYQQKLNPYTEGLPDSVQEKFDDRYKEFFELFLKHHDKISRVTLWGVNDGDSWKNNWPVRGRTDYPLLFNRDNTPKEVVKELIKLAAKS